MKIKIIEPVTIDNIKKGEVYEGIEEIGKGFMVKDDEGKEVLIYRRECKEINERKIST